VSPLTRGTATTYLNYWVGGSLTNCGGVACTIATATHVEFSILANDNSQKCAYNNTLPVGTNISGTAVTDATWATYCVPAMTTAQFTAWVDGRGGTVGYSILNRVYKRVTVNGVANTVVYLGVVDWYDTAFGVFNKSMLQRTA